MATRKSTRSSRRRRRRIWTRSRTSFNGFLHNRISLSCSAIRGKKMSQSNAGKGRLLLGAMVGLVACTFAGTAFALDAVAAKSLARKESCLRCHAVGKKKEGPSYQSVAYKYKGQDGALEKLVGHIT